MNTFKTIQDVQDFISSFSRNGKTDRELMKEIGQDTVMAILEVRGATKLFAEFCGFANPGVVSVATADMGWRIAGTRGNGGGNVKIKGSLPYKTAFAIAKVLGDDPDPEDFDPESVFWSSFKLALDKMGESWLDLLFQRLGGKESDGGKAFTAWIDSNTASDEAAAKKADPRIKARMKAVDRMRSMLKVFEEGLWSDEFEIIQSAIQSLEDLD